MSALDHALSRPVSDATVNERLAFLRRVYGWMAAGLLTTAIGAAISIESGLAFASLQMGFFAHLLIVLAWMGGASVAMGLRHRPGVNVIAFAAYALFTGFVISDVILVSMLVASSSGASSLVYVMQALVTTVVTFTGLSVYAMTTKRDFTMIGGLLVAGVLVLVCGGIANHFIGSSGFSLVLTSLGVLVFSAFILYDTQKIVRTYPLGEHVAAAMALFLNFVLLFLYLLRLILSLSRD